MENFLQISRWDDKPVEILAAVSKSDAEFEKFGKLVVELVVWVTAGFFVVWTCVYCVDGRCLCLFTDGRITNILSPCGRWITVVVALFKQSKQNVPTINDECHDESWIIWIMWKINLQNGINCHGCCRCCYCCGGTVTATAVTLALTAMTIFANMLALTWSLVDLKSLW